MLSINGPEFLVIVVIALIVIGPERLPQYAQQLGRAVRELRSMAMGARDQVRAELGEDFDDVDWQKLDPRQYDPRRIVREALSDVWDDDAPPAAAAGKKVSAKPGSTTPANPLQKRSAGPRATTVDTSKPAARPGSRPGGGASRPGDVTGPAPYDAEAT